MRKLKYVLITLIALMIVSCIPSLHSIVNDQNRTTDGGIIGNWSLGDEDDSSWFFEQASEITFQEEHSTMFNKIHYDIGAVSLMPKGMKVIKNIELPQYVLTHKEWEDGDTITTYLIINLTKIGQSTYMDFKPLPVESNARDGIFSFNYIYGHTFARYKVQEGKLIIEFIDGQYIQQLIEKKRIRLKHELIDDEVDIVLTASTEELRAFILKYENDEDLFDEPGELLSL